MQTRFAEFVMRRRLRLAIGINAGLELAGVTMQQAVSQAEAQAAAALALHERFQTPVLMTGMDLSVEAETFGCAIRFAEDEVPTVTGRRVQTLADIAALTTPGPQPGRLPVYLEAARQLAATGKPVLGGMIGPFSLAGRLFGVAEALEATAAEPALVITLLEKVTPFLIDYALAFRETGAAGVIMAEPAAGLLSPRALGRFSAPYVRRIVEAVQTPDFAFILHNCGAKLVHLPKLLESGVEIHHFGAPMDLPAALERVAEQVILSGNLDPAEVFLNGTPESIRAHRRALLDATVAYPNFFVSSGCDLPPGVPVENLTAFYEA